MAINTATKTKKLTNEMREGDGEYIDRGELRKLTVKNRRFVANMLRNYADVDWEDFSFND